MQNQINNIIRKRHANTVLLFWHILSDVHHAHPSGGRLSAAEQTAQNASLAAALRTRYEREEFVFEYRIGQIANAQEMTATGDSCEHHTYRFGNIYSLACNNMAHTYESDCHGRTAAPCRRLCTNPICP